MFPLTMDCPINPFRVRTTRAGESEFLLHAIMAVSSQHLAKKTNRPELNLQVHNHRSTAMHSFIQALSQSDPWTLLDALLILVSLDVSMFIPDPSITTDPVSLLNLPSVLGQFILTVLDGSLSPPERWNFVKRALVFEHRSRS